MNLNPFRWRRERVLSRLPAIAPGYDMVLALNNRKICRKDNQSRSLKGAETKRAQAAAERRAAHSSEGIAQ